jgi:molecular chaperone GrpE
MKYKRKEKSKAEDLQQADQQERKTQEGELEDQHDTIESLQKEKDELFAKLQRVSADYANFQKRVPKQISDTLGYEKERIIKTLLPALDNFEHTLQNAHSAENVDVLVKGIRIIYDQLLDILKSHNVEQIEALGEKFDPAMHQAMTQQSNPEKEENVVLEEFQKGYSLNGRVIRPSRVIVNKLPEEKPGDRWEAEPPEQPEDEYDEADGEEITDTE